MAKQDLHDRTISDGRDVVRKFCLWEKQLDGYSLPFPLKWKRIQAKKTNKSSLPDSQGIYAFVVRPEIANLDWCGYVLYVGKTKSQTFPKRFSQYFTEPNRKKPRLWVGEMLELWKDYLYYYYAETDSTKATRAEDELLKALLPPNNEKFLGGLGKIKKEIYK